MLLAALALALSPQSTDELPFKMELPGDYVPFLKDDGDTPTWVALHPSGNARFTAVHYLLANAGATSAAVAQDHRARIWTPFLDGVKYQITPWIGPWAGDQAAGTDIQYSRNGSEMAVIERVLVQADHLTLVSWEGPQHDMEPARKALSSFQPPFSWRPKPPQQEDFDRGLGSNPAPLFSLGHYDLQLSTHLQPGTLHIKLDFQPSAELGTLQSIQWWIPAQESKKTTAIEGKHHLEYALEFGDDPELAASMGISLSGHTIGLLDSTWLAVPLLQDINSDQVLAPSWTLSLAIPAFDHALSWCAPITNKVLGSSGARKISFPSISSGRAWPFALVGQYRKHNEGPYPMWLRSGSRSREYRAPLQFLVDLEGTMLDWLPGNVDPWSLATFPGAGDRMLPGLAILDEKKEWLQSPLDAAYGSGTRREGLAELISTRKFGLLLRGKGTAAPFLEISLAEYSAWRLLRIQGHSKEAANMLLNWKKREANLPPVRTPLSLMLREDLLGPQRLLSRGALVWVHLSELVGEDRLDACLNAALREGGWWTSEDLRLALEEMGKLDLLPFFRKYIYGIHPLPQE